MNRLHRLLWQIKMSDFVWPFYQRLFKPWPPRGWKYITEKITTNDGSRREIKYPWPPGSE